jgi:hypothetical protein
VQETYQVTSSQSRRVDDVLNQELSAASWHVIWSCSTRERDFVHGSNMWSEVECTNFGREIRTKKRNLSRKLWT